MAFQIKDFASIVAAQINHARAVTDKVTDFAPGSVVRTIIEAPAIEMEELYLQMFLGLRDAIPVATFQSFGFDRLPSTRAFGRVSVSSSSPLVNPITIPAGTSFFTASGGRFNSVSEVVWAAGSSLVQIPVEAADVGAAGNVSINTIVSSPFFTDTAHFTIGNQAITNGADVESDAEREARFADFVRSLSRGTVFACVNAVAQTRILDEDGNISEFVTRTGYDEVPGRMRIWAYTNRGLVSTELLALAQQTIDGYRTDAGEIVPGYRPGGVRIDVLAMVERTVPLSIKVRMLDGYSITSAVRQELEDIFGQEIREVAAGETLYLGTLVERMLAATGVAEIVPQTTANITCDPSEALIPGALTIAAL